MADIALAALDGGEALVDEAALEALRSDLRGPVLQPDVVKCGGISEMSKIAVLSETYSKHFLPHQTQPTIRRLAMFRMAVRGDQ